MSAQDVLLSARQQGVFFYLKDNKLAYNVKKNVLSPELKESIKAYRVEIVKYLEEAASQKNKFILPPVKPANRTQALPLSYAQQRLWFIDQLEGGSVQYNVPGRFMLQGQFDMAAFKQALNSLLGRHETLRTHFKTVDGKAQQVIVRDYDLPLIYHDLSQLDDVDKSSQLQQLFQEEARTPFNLGSDLMLRVRLLKLSGKAHIILYTMHHITSDGWSQEILQNELRVLYQAYRRKEANPLTPLNIQYADYAVWQRNWLQGDVLEKQLNYWQKKLAGIPTLHQLPLDNVRPEQQIFEGMAVHQRLNKKTTEKIRAFCEIHDVTLFMFMQTAFAVLIGRYSNETDIVMGTAIAGRTHTDLEALIGFFINTLVLRTDLSNNSSFGELLKNNREVILDAYAHQHIPFEMLVEELHPERHLSFNPVFQILFVLQNNERGALVHHTQNGNCLGKNHSLSFSKNISIKYDLELYVSELSDGVSLDWAYNNSLFEEASISRMATNFQVLLNSIVGSLSGGKNAEKHINMLDMLTEDEKQAVLCDRNKTLTNYQERQCIHELFEQQVKLHPEAIALAYENKSGEPQQLSYSKLNHRSNQMAHYLISQGVAAEVRVGLCVEHSLDMVVGILGILKAGGCYVPLDPLHPSSRLAYLIKDSGVALILTQSALKRTLGLTQMLCGNKDEGVELPVCCVNLDEEWGAQLYGEDNPSLELSASNVAYVIYTSGSTGRAKGVMGLHGGIVNRINWLDRKIGVKRDDVLCQKTSLSFVDHVAEIFQALSSGVPLIILVTQVVQSPALLLQRLNAWRVSQITLVPSLLKVLLESDGAIRAPWLRAIYSSGEKLSLPRLADVVYTFPQARLFNFYGSTEVSADVSAHEVTESYRLEANGGYISSQNIVNESYPVAELIPLIGKSIDNSQAYVLNPQGQAVPQGVPGELYIGGAGLSRGYQANAGLTAERFVPHHFSKQPGERLYRTGDRVRYLPSGNLEFLGRFDEQVKIRGFRIEIGEIENTLLKHEQVKEVAVLAHKGVNTENYLVAYVVSKALRQVNEVAGTKNNLKRQFETYLNKALPEYMVPAVYVFLERLPLTSSGKVDKRRLPLPGESDLQKEEYVAPRDEVEERLCTLWKGLLIVEKIGIFDNFFALGGHSLLATRLVSLIRREFSVELPLRVLFESPTVIKLAECVKKSLVNDKDPIAILPSQTHYDISHAQKVAWAHNQMSLANNWISFFIQSTIMVSNADFDKVGEALKILFQRHEIFRTTVRLVAGDLKQIVHENIQFDPDKAFMDISNSKDPKAEIEKIKTKDFYQTVDLSKLPLFNVKIIKIRKLCCILLTIDHVCSDANSLEICKQEFQQIYKDLIDNNPVALSPLKVDYKEYSAWEYQEINGENSAEHRQYWHSLLIDNLEAFNPVRYFSDFNPDHTLSYRDSFEKQIRHIPKQVNSLYPNIAYGVIRHIFITPLKTSRYQFVVDEKLCVALKSLAADFQVMFSVLVIASINILLNKLTGQQRSVMSILSDTRVHGSLSYMVGCFVNDVLFVSEVTDEMTVYSICKLVEKQLNASYKHKVYPMTKMASELDISLAAMQTIQLNFINFSEKKMEYFAPKHMADGVADMGIHLDIRAYKNGMEIDCQYSRELFKADTIESVMQYYLSLLNKLVQNQDKTVGFFSRHPSYPAVNSGLKKRQIKSPLQLSQKSKIKSVRKEVGEAATYKNPVYRVSSQEYYEVSFRQRNSWVFSQIRQAYQINSFLVQKLICFRKSNVDRLNKALDILLQRHEILRTTIHVVCGRLQQKVHPYIKIDLNKATIDLTGLDNLSFGIRKIKNKVLNQTLDISKPPLIDVKLIKDSDDYFILLTIDHACVDLVSMNVLERELVGIYELISRDKYQDLPPVDVAYKDYAAWEYLEIYGDNGKRHRQYWHALLKNNLEAINPLMLFSDYNPNHVFSYRNSFKNQFNKISDKITEPLFPSIAYGVVRSIHTEPQQIAGYISYVSEELYLSLKNLAKKYQVMFSVLVISTVNVLLYKLTGKEKIIVSVFGDTRIHENLTQTVGNFAHDTLFLSEIKKYMEVASICSTVESQLSRSYEHKVYPMTKIASELDVSLAGFRNIRIDFVKHKKRIEQFTPQHVEGGIVGLGMNIRLSACENGMIVDCRYSRKLFKGQTIESIMQYYSSLLNEIVRNPGNPLSDIRAHPDFPRSD